MSEPVKQWPLWKTLLVFFGLMVVGVPVIMMIQSAIGPNQPSSAYQHREASKEASSSGWYQCSLACDVVSECQGLARDRRGRVMDAEGQTSCNRARRSCLDRCHERFSD